MQKTPRPPQASAPEPPAPRPIHPCKHISPPPCKRKPTWVGGDKGRPIWAHLGPHSLRIRAPPDTDRKTDDWLSDKRRQTDRDDMYYRSILMSTYKARSGRIGVSETTTVSREFQSGKCLTRLRSSGKCRQRRQHRGKCRQRRQHRGIRLRGFGKGRKRRQYRGIKLRSSGKCLKRRQYRGIGLRSSGKCRKRRQYRGMRLRMPKS